jgi:cobalamin biosynthesis Co2+ chelatase CbiK
VNATEYDRETRTINDVLTQLKGLVLVQPILEARGVSNDELERHMDEIDRVRSRLAELVRSSGGGVESAAAAA